MVRGTPKVFTRVTRVFASFPINSGEIALWPPEKDPHSEAVILGYLSQIEHNFLAGQ